MDLTSLPSTPHEYAERHLELLQELQFERQEEARLKKLCQEQNHPLEDSSDGDDDDIYRQTLESLESGAARIDSLHLIKNARLDSVSATLPTDSTFTNDSERIGQWAIQVSEDSNVTSEITHSDTWSEAQEAYARGRCARAGGQSGSDE